jgi:mono/diheme cytochrome c family protein
VGKSAMMPPYGKVLSKDEIRSVIAYIRAIAVPPYSALVNNSRRYSEK